MSRQRLVSVLLVIALAIVALGDDSADSPRAKVSYDEQIRPVFQANCQGCHQRAKASGEYVMTAFDRLLKGGESETSAISPGEPDNSYLIELITPTDGEAEMPQGKPPLAESEIDLIRRWIAEGAVDDSPATVGQRYDKDHPPVYTRPPVITSLDYSPDGSLLAVAGFHEVLLLEGDGSQPVARLVGMSERIEAVRFSPDGARLLVTGGLPARMGEVQVWDVNRRALLLSLPVTSDTVYGGSWSPDGKQIALGCADSAVRAIDAATGREVVYMAAHDDLVRDTVFSTDGKSVLSVSRDQTVKMTDVGTQRFLGNVTTHTPGILRGGISAIERHPQRDEVLVGGADGTPKLFKMAVAAAPAGGGNPNQIRHYGQMPGRVFDVSFQPDGGNVFAGSSLDGKGQVRAYETDSGKQTWSLDVPASGIYAITCSADGKTVATGGTDGWIRLIDAATGALQTKFLPVQISEDSGASTGQVAAQGAVPQPAEQQAPSSLSEDSQVVALAVDPQRVEVASPVDYVQLLLTARLSDDRQVDVTRSARWSVEGDVGTVSSAGVFRPRRNGTGRIVAQFEALRVEQPVQVTGLDARFQPDFIHDVNPILSRLGCNAGTCHGAAKGKNGFKLSLRGYDALLDVRSLTDDLASRRVSVASPVDSLILLKATASVPHQGGQVIRQSDDYYPVIRAWIASGAKLDRSTPRVAKIEIRPIDPVLQDIGQTQQMRVIATYGDGASRDVTHEAFIGSGNTEVATARPSGVLTAVRRGEAPVLARYEGAYAATTMTVMGDRTGFAWEQPETWGRIDALVAGKWERMKIRPSGLCSDVEYVRRVHLDLTGLPPTADDVRDFIRDTRDTRTKRYELIDELIGSDDYVDYWTNKWADLLQVNRKYLGKEGAATFRQWIRDEVAANTPYDEFAHKILTATGSNRENPAASYFKILRDPPETMENTTQLFLAVRFNCNKCHDHPFERWTQDQYYQTAAFFARLELQPDPAAGDKKIGGTAVEGAKPQYEIVADKPQGEVVHDRTKAVTPPRFPFECGVRAPAGATRRQQLAAWVTAPDNPYFARSYVNRLWGYLLGVGIIEPLDDIRAGNPPTNPELLAYLAGELIDSDFDVRHVIRLICQSRTYQLSLETNAWNTDDKINYSHAVARRLPAEVLYDAIHRVTGTVSRIPGVPVGTRAAALPDAGVELSDGFLASLGRPARESACECERSSGLQLGSVMSLISGPTVGQALADPGNALAKLATSEMNDAQLIDKIFMRTLSRPATQAEIDTAMESLRELPQEHARLLARLNEHEQQLAAKTAEQEKLRREAIDTAQSELADYEQKIAAREAELDRKHQEQIARAEAAVKQQEQQLPERLAAWEKAVKQPTAWAVLDPVDLSSTSQTQLAKKADLSVVASGPNGKATYTFVARTELQNITGVKLEVLADDRLPSKGPGRAPNGNFVLTEFRLEWAPDDEPNKKTPVAFGSAQADFSQDKYAVKTAIDGKKTDRENGWATSPKTGENRTGVFEARQNFGSSPGILTFYLDQVYQDGQHTIGRFRISVTTSPQPLTLDGLSKNIANILAVPTDRRTDPQKAELAKYYRGVDSEFQKLKRAFVEARQPRPVDPKLQQLHHTLAEVRKPLPVDPKLAELRGDGEMSARQLAGARLTFAQDLAWALINSPAFLFNH
jgi:WD40 repeat protein